MAETKFNVRIQNKYDTYANWLANDPILKSGEIAVATIPTNDEHGVATSLPTVLLKVGDGTSHYSALKFVAAPAADVHEWAKKNETEFTTWVRELISTEGVYDTKGSAEQALKDAKAYTDQLKNGAVKTNTDAIAAIKDGTTINTFSAAETAIADAKKAGTDAQTAVNTLSGKVGTVPADKTVVEMIADAQAAATYDDTTIKASIKANTDAITKLNGADTVDGSVKKQIKDAKTELQGNIDTVSGKVTTLIGEDTNKSVRTIANEELAAQLIAEGADQALDTLQEIAQWIQDHPKDASAMNTAITALQTKVDTGDKKVSEYVTEAITALKIGDYAKAADLAALAGRVGTLEADTHTHTNKTVLDAITNAKVAAWDKVSEKANTADLAAIATSGNVKDLTQTAGDILVFDCGSSSKNI